MKYDLWASEREKAENIDGLLLVLKGDGERPTLKAWKPKAMKPHVNYYFKTTENRDEYLAQLLDGARKHVAMVQDRKEERKGTPEMLDTVKVGDIFHFSWGYDQTNVDYYQVIARNGYNVTLREIACRNVEKNTGNSMADYVVAAKDSFLENSEPFTKRLQFRKGKPYIKMRSYGWCTLWDGRENYRSWYA